MNLSNQLVSLNELYRFHESNIHSILIQGSSGVGKTYLANEFAKLKNKEYGYAQFHVVEPKVNDLKELISNSFNLSDIQVVCIENLDQGVNASSQVILKYLEEPLPNVYIIITCRNSAKLPDTIISRSVMVSMPNPTCDDIVQFAKFKNQRVYENIKDTSIFKCVKSYSDIVSILNLSLDYIKYYDVIKTKEFWNSTIDQISWNLSHYPDNSKTNLKFIFKVLWRSNLNSLIRLEALDALKSLELGRISESAILNKFVINSKIVERR